MDVVIKSRNLEVTDALQSYIERKVSRLDRFLPNIGDAQFDLSVQNARNAQQRQVAQLTLRTSSGAILRVEEHSSDMRSSIDLALEKMSRRVKRYKGKHWQSQTRVAEETLPLEDEEESEPELDSTVVRTKRFQTRPMDVEEAIEQMELLGHDFFIFYDIDSNGFNVVYRRRDGGYGLLIPELA
jgi:putative sigma-54 modulation protein